MTANPALRVRAVLLGVSALVYAAGFWPTWWVRDSVLRAAGFPAYVGLWKFLPHLLLYSTLPAIVAATAWVALARAQVLGRPLLGRGNHAATSALQGAVAAIAVTLAALAALANAIRFWPAAIVTSALWAAMHTQFPLPLRVAVFLIGVVLASVMERAGTLWAPWGAHMIMDAVLDSFVRLALTPR